MADDASRLWQLTDDELLTHFDTRYPQESRWQLWTLVPDTNSTLIGALSKRPPDHEFLHSGPSPPVLPDDCRPCSATPLTSIPTHSQPTLSPCSSSLPNTCAVVPSLPAIDLCGLATWRRSSARWARRTPGWGPLTLAKTRTEKLDFRLSSLLRSWAQTDLPPSRVKSLPITLLRRVVTLAHQANCLVPRAKAATLTIGVFFLLRPGEYVGHPNDATDSLFRLRDL